MPLHAGIGTAAVKIATDSKIMLAVYNIDKGTRGAYKWFV